MILDAATQRDAEAQRKPEEIFLKSLQESGVPPSSASLRLSASLRQNFRSYAVSVAPLSRRSERQNRLGDWRGLK
jgi:hypothetical protein